MEDDEREDAGYGNGRGDIDQQGRCRYHSNHPEHHTHPTQTLAESWSFEHGYPERNDT